MLSSIIANIILQVILIATLNIFMYFTYTTLIEKSIVESESKRIVFDITNDLRLTLPTKTLAEINKIISPYLVMPDLSKEDAEVLATNRSLTITTVKLLVVLILIGFIVVIAMSIYFKFNLNEIIYHNMIILIFVALVEFVFLTFIVKNYITIDSNYVKYKILESFSDFVKNKSN